MLLNSNVTYRLRQVAYPDLTLSRAFALPSQGIVHDAVRIVVDYFEDLYTNSNNRTNRTAAFAKSEAHLRRGVNLFKKYEGDYALSQFQRETALTAWLCQNCIDPTDPDNWGGYDPKQKQEYAVIDLEALSILAFLEYDDRWFPKLSYAEGDGPLAINVGLQILTRLENRAKLYRIPGQYEHRKLTPHEDRHYAFSILTDRPLSPDTALAVDCRAAADLIEKLRNFAPARHAKPV